eukprot:gene18898-38348_t
MRFAPALTLVGWERVTVAAGSPELRSCAGMTLAAVGRRYANGYYDEQPAASAEEVATTSDGLLSIR